MLKTNQNRLITPYNLFSTLKHISEGFKETVDDTIFSKISVDNKCKLSKIEHKCNCK